ncbi:hypothetical protein V5799_020027 [Amblyomma americanum]|uniref:Peptidase M13 C-terminal domain-containing protein n=1 Tax=Amblyomma americanum TaxID=6943 RepID=A0AAQ4EV84_AMBAM
MSENIADFSGTVSAHQAFLGHGDRTTLGDLKYDAEQLFFVASCLKWCSEGSALQPKKYASWADRCNVPLRNVEAFAEAFQCPAGVEMHPELRCTFW